MATKKNPSTTKATSKTTPASVSKSETIITPATPQSIIIQVPAANPINIIMSILLLVSSFVLGSLHTRVSVLEGKYGSAAPIAANNTPPANPAAPEVNAISLAQLAQDAGADTSKFQECMAQKPYDQKVSDQAQTGADAGVNGTPGTIILNQKGQAELVVGALPYQEVKKLVDQYLAGEGTPLGDLKISPVTTKDHIRGDLKAQVIMIEYSDLQCPYCKQFHSTMQQIKEEYADQVTWVYRHFPLDSIHPDARPAANAAECIANNDGEDSFWEFVDNVFQADSFKS